MADDKDKATKIAEAICETLLATGLFANGTGIPYGRDEIGPRPAFMVWWDGFTDNAELQSGAQLPAIVHRFEVDFFISARGKGCERDDQQRLRALVLTCGQALQRNFRLNGTCLAARMRSGESDMKADGNNLMWAMAAIVEARVSAW